MTEKPSVLQHKTVRRAFIGGAYILHKTIRLALTLVIWMFLADFLFQFVHSRMDGTSLPERVHSVTAVVQTPLEMAAGIDMRYDYHGALVDLMPLAFVTAAFLLRRRARFAYQHLRTAIQGPPPELLAVHRLMTGQRQAESPVSDLEKTAPATISARLVQ
jgi:hypothetical protein